MSFVDYWCACFCLNGQGETIEGMKAWSSHMEPMLPAQQQRAKFVQWIIFAIYALNWTYKLCCRQLIILHDAFRLCYGCLMCALWTCSYPWRAKGTKYVQTVSIGPTCGCWALIPSWWSLFLTLRDTCTSAAFKVNFAGLCQLSSCATWHEDWHGDLTVVLLIFLCPPPCALFYWHISWHLHHALNTTRGQSRPSCYSSHWCISLD